jgi:uncharacterized coiled-coil protein SlyX
MNVSDDDGGDSRVDHLESRLAFLEHTVDVLSGELESQQKDNRMLHKKIEGLQEQLESVQRDTGVDGSQDEPPPHY